MNDQIFGICFLPHANSPPFSVKAEREGDVTGNGQSYSATAKEGEILIDQAQGQVDTDENKGGDYYWSALEIPSLE